MKLIWNEIEKLTEQFKQLNFKDVIDFEKFHYYSLVYNSTALEGSTLTELDTQLLLDDNLTASGKPLEHHLMVKDNYKALKYAIEKANAKELPSPELLKELNANNMKNTGQIVNSVMGTSDGTKGEFRLVQAFSQALGYYLDPKKIPSAVELLCEEIRNKMLTGLSVKVAYKLSFSSHFNLVYIHPWSDGNKRTSRLLMNYIQCYYGLPLSKVYVEDSHEYLEALKNSKKSENIDLFSDFMAKQQVKYLKEKITDFENSQKKPGMTFLF